MISRIVSGVVHGVGNLDCAADEFARARPLGDAVVSAGGMYPVEMPVDVAGWHLYSISACVVLHEASRRRTKGALARGVLATGAQHAPASSRAFTLSKISSLLLCHGDRASNATRASFLLKSMERVALDASGEPQARATSTLVIELLSQPVFESKHAAILHNLLESPGGGAVVVEVDEHGNTPLIAACYIPDIEARVTVVNLLIAFGSDVHEVDSNGT